MPAHTSFQGLTLSEIRERVQVVEEALQEYVKGRSMMELAAENDLSHYLLRGAVLGVHNYNPTLDHLIAATLPRKHLHQLQGFTTDQKKAIKENAMARALAGMDLEKAVVESEVEMERDILAIVERQIQVHGIMPQWENGTITIQY